MSIFISLAVFQRDRVLADGTDRLPSLGIVKDTIQGHTGGTVA
jgi:hypothetical protein